MNILEFNNVTKNIFNFDIKPTNIYLKSREILGILGLKGSGKTTLCNLILNFYRPKTGSITVFGMDSVKDSKQIKMDLGVIPESTWFDENIKPMTYIRNSQKIRGVNDKEEIKYLLDYFDLKLPRKVTEMNLLELKKLTIVAALSSNPKLIIVDEPDSIPDSATRMKLFNILDEKNREGASVLIFSSNLREAQSICQNIYFLDRGEIIKQENQRNKLSNDKILKFYDTDVDKEIIEKTGAKLVKTGDETAYYFSGPLNTLSEAIYRSSLIDYTLEDSNLAEKITILKKDRLYGIDTDNQVEIIDKNTDDKESVMINNNEDNDESDISNENTVIINYNEEELNDLIEIPEDNKNSNNVIDHEIKDNELNNDNYIKNENKSDDTIIIKQSGNSSNVIIKDIKESSDIKKIEDKTDNNLDENLNPKDIEGEEI